MSAFRDRVALAALQGLLANQPTTNHDALAKRCYEIAEAFEKARRSTEQKPETLEQVAHRLYRECAAQNPLYPQRWEDLDEKRKAWWMLQAKDEQEVS